MRASPSRCEKWSPEEPAARCYEVVDETVELNTSERFEQRRQYSIGVLELRGLEPTPPVGDSPGYVATLHLEATK